MRFTIPTNVVTVQPKCEPVGVEDVKANAYVVDDDTANALISDTYIPTARRWVEELAKRSLITQTRVQYYDDMPCSPLWLRYGPVQSVSSFTYTDTNEAIQTVAESLYDVDTKRIHGARIDVGYNDSWPSSIRKLNSIAVTYVAGYGAQPAAVPRIYRSAITWLAGHWHENRDPFCSMTEELISKLESMLSIEGRTVEYA